MIEFQAKRKISLSGNQPLGSVLFLNKKQSRTFYGQRKQISLFLCRFVELKLRTFGICCKARSLFIWSCRFNNDICKLFLALSWEIIGRISVHADSEMKQMLRSTLGIA